MLYRNVWRRYSWRNRNIRQQSLRIREWFTLLEHTNNIRHSVADVTHTNIVYNQDQEHEELDAVLSWEYHTEYVILPSHYNIPATASSFAAVAMYTGCFFRGCRESGSLMYRSKPKHQFEIRIHVSLQYQPRRCKIASEYDSYKRSRCVVYSSGMCCSMWVAGLVFLFLA